MCVRGSGAFAFIEDAKYIDVTQLLILVIATRHVVRETTFEYRFSQIQIVTEILLWNSAASYFSNMNFEPQTDLGASAPVCRSYHHHFPPTERSLFTKMSVSLSERMNIGIISL